MHSVIWEKLQNRKWDKGAESIFHCMSGFAYWKSLGLQWPQIPMEELTNDLNAVYTLLPSSTTTSVCMNCNELLMKASGNCCSKGHITINHFTGKS